MNDATIFVENKQKFSNRIMVQLFQLSFKDELNN